MLNNSEMESQRETNIISFQDVRRAFYRPLRIVASSDEIADFTEFRRLSRQKAMGLLASDLKIPQEILLL